MHCCGHLSGINISIWIFSGYEAVFNYSLIALCSLSNSAAVHSASLSPKTELEVSIISFFDRMLQKWCFYTCYCLVLVARPCCSMYCNMQIYWRYTNHFQTSDIFLMSHTLCTLHYPKCPHHCYPLESPPPLCPRNLLWWCFRKKLCVDGKACGVVEYQNFLL